MSVRSLRNSVHNAPSLRYRWFISRLPASLATSNIASSNVNGTLAHWETIIRPTRGTQQRFVNTQAKMFPGYPPALF